jgi:hypothetical protein
MTAGPWGIVEDFDNTAALSPRTRPGRAPGHSGLVAVFGFHFMSSFTLPVTRKS